MIGEFDKFNLYNPSDKNTFKIGGEYSNERSNLSLIIESGILNGKMHSSLRLERDVKKCNSRYLKEYLFDENLKLLKSNIYLQRNNDQILIGTDVELFYIFRDFEDIRHVLGSVSNFTTISKSNLLIRTFANHNSSLLSRHLSDAQANKIGYNH